MISIGQLLREERENHNLKIEDIEKATKIRKKYLTAIETSSWDSFPSKTYILGVIKSYGKFLKLDEEKLLAFFRREYEKNEEIRFKRRVPKYALAPETKRVFKIILSAITLVFLFYFGYQLKLYFSPPNIEIIEPQETQFSKKQKIDLVGKTEKEAIVMINGERVFQNDSNIFKISISLKEGKNKVVIEITGANGRKTTVIKEFLAKNIPNQ